MQPDKTITDWDDAEVGDVVRVCCEGYVEGSLGFKTECSEWCARNHLRTVRVEAKGAETTGKEASSS